MMSWLAIARPCDRRHTRWPWASSSVQPWMEAIMRSAVRRLIFGMAVAVGFSAVAVSAIGGAVAQSAERAPTLTHDGVISGYDSAPFEGGGRLGAASSSSTIF